MRRTHKKLQRLNPICQASSHKYAQSAEIHFQASTPWAYNTSRVFINCQGKCQECDASGSPCDLTRSTGPCSTCRSSGKTLSKSRSLPIVIRCGNVPNAFAAFDVSHIPRRIALDDASNCVEDDLPLPTQISSWSQSEYRLYLLPGGGKGMHTTAYGGFLVLAEDEMGESSKWQVTKIRKCLRSFSIRW